MSGTPPRHREREILGFPVPGSRTPDDPDGRSEYDAILRACAHLQAPWERRIDVTGRDAGAFLHNLLTQRVTGQPGGASVPAAMADRKGHLVADLRLLVRPDGEGYQLRVAARAEPRVLEVLERHHIMEDVAFRRAHDEPSGLLLLGPATADLPSRLGWGGSGTGGGPIEGLAGASWMRVDEVTPHDLVVFAELRDLAALEERLIAHGSRPIGWDAFDRRRIEIGRAWFGIDADSDRLVPEPGFGDRISYDKGCYLGQEPLARLHYRGRPSWELARFRAPGAAGLLPGTEIRDEEGRRVGWITSFASTERGLAALGYLHRKLRETPGPLRLPDGTAIDRAGDDPIS